MGSVSTVGEYRQNAVDCIQLAKAITDVKRKLAIIDMAQAWQRLAEQAEINERRQLAGPHQLVPNNP